MRLIATLFVLASLTLAPAVRPRAYTLQYTSTAATTQLRWPTTNITVALSTSLNNPPSYVRATGAQVVLAARRALSRWALASNIQFNVVQNAGLQDAVADDAAAIADGVTGTATAAAATTFGPAAPRRPRRRPRR